MAITITWKDFWKPITDPTLRWWRQSHVLAHLIGGVVWYALVANPWVTQHWIYGHAASRVLAVVALQVGWERVQQENFGSDSSGYPWWSAAWDVLFAVAPVVVIEIVRGMLSF